MYAHTPFRCTWNRTAKSRHHDADPTICAGGSGLVAQQAWLRSVEEAVGNHRKALDQYFRKVYLISNELSGEEHLQVRAAGITFFWNSVPGRSTFAMSWGCADCPHHLGVWPTGMLFAPQEDAQFNPVLCGDVRPCNKTFLLDNVSPEMLRFPGVFVQRFVHYNLQPHFEHGIPDGSYVEVFRAARVELPRAHDRLKWCSKGQMWFWLAYGSGIWLDLGRSLRLVTGRFKGCHAARQDGYDTVQMPRSMSGYMYEVNNGNCKAPFATCSHFFSRSCVRLVSPRHTAQIRSSTAVARS